MKNYQIEIEWEIRDTRDLTGGFRTGRSILVVEGTQKGAINSAINFARDIPSWELKKNNIDLQDYREGKTCRYHYLTMISKIINIKCC